MWKSIEKELGKANVEDLGYDHPLCSGILDDSSFPFTKISKDSCEVFREQIKIYIIPSNEFLKITCEEFVQKEKEKDLSKLSVTYGNARFGEFLDGPEKLLELTNQILEVLSRIWASPKWKSYMLSGEPSINEGSYVCEVISPLLNIVMSGLPVDINVWGVW